MFRPVPMLRLSAVVLERDKRAVLCGLGRLGAVQLTHTAAGAETAPLAPPDHSEELARCDRLSARCAELQRSLEISTGVAAEAPPEFTLDAAEKSLRLLEERAGELLQRRQQFQHRREELTVAGDQVASYRGLEVPLDQIGQFDFLHFVTGSLPAEKLAQLDVGDDVALLPLPQESGRQPLIALTTRRGRPGLEAALQKAGFRHEQLPTLENETADTLFERGRHEQEQVAAELVRSNTELTAIATEAAQPLAEIEQRVIVERRLLEAEQNFPRTVAAVLITGWVPAADAPTLEEHLKEVTAGRYAVEFAAPGNVPEEQIPVLLRHARLLRPFEMLVTAYGLPRYQELAPTLFVAVSFVLMFGMMFGDAGQGGVLALAGLIALLASRARKVREAGWLVLCAGLSSACFGVVYGSYFGLTQLKRYALWRDPLEGNPIGLMVTAMGIGVGLMSLGLILNIMNRFRRKDVLGGLLDKFGVAGVVFYWGALALLLKYEVFQTRGLVTWAVALFLALPIAGWMLKEPLEYVLRRRRGHATEADGLGGALIESVVGAFEGVLTYFANTVSFVRLAAYAMSHAALLMAAFMMAAEVERLSVGGSALGVVVIILGNLVAIVLEGIVATVQALRLEYYEFFGKFFSGSGQAFQPFRLGVKIET